MKKKGQKELYKQYILHFGVWIVPVAGTLVLIGTGAVLTNASANSNLNMIINSLGLWLGWFFQVGLLAAVRKNNRVKLYMPLVLGRYFFVIAAVSVFVSVIILQFQSLAYGQPSAIHTIFAGQFFAALFCNLWLDIFLLSIQKTDTEEKAAQLQVQKIKSEVDMLKMQLSPHFVYNSLNTLSYLTTSSPEKARTFINRFSGVYKYVMESITNDWIKASREISFVKEYIELEKIKSGKNIMLFIKGEDQAGRFYLSPLSLQLLAENAIKHNYFSADVPLTISIEFNQSQVIVSNPIQPSGRIASTKLGLHNLNERYKLLTHQEIQVVSSAGYFSVALPLIKNIPHASPDHRR